MIVGTCEDLASITNAQCAAPASYVIENIDYLFSEEQVIQQYVPIDSYP